MKWQIALDWGGAGLCLNTVEDGKDRVSREGETVRCGLGPPSRRVFLSLGLRVGRESSIHLALFCAPSPSALCREEAQSTHHSGVGVRLEGSLSTQVPIVFEGPH